MEQQQLCVLACQQLGGAGALLFAAAAFVYGLWQRKGKVAVAAEKQQIVAEKQVVEAERDQLRKLSLSPPPAMVIPVAPELWRAVQSSLTPPPPTPVDLEQPPPQADDPDPAARR